MIIKPKDIETEKEGMFNPLYVMTVVSKTYNTQQLDFYLFGGRLYYIVRDEYPASIKAPMHLADFISEANPVSIKTVFDLRGSFMWGITKTRVSHIGRLSAYYKDFKYTAVVLYESINSTIGVYGYSNTSYLFAANKAREFIEPLVSVCNDINYEIDKGYDPLNDPIPTKLLLEIKKVIM